MLRPEGYAKPGLDPAVFRSEEALDMLTPHWVFLGHPETRKYPGIASQASQAYRHGGASFLGLLF